MITGIRIVAVPVDDIDAALRFYCQVLGMEKRKDRSGSEGDRYIEVAPPGSSVALSPYLMSPLIATRWRQARRRWRGRRGRTTRSRSPRR